MTDAVHDQHWRLAAGRAVSSPPVPNFFAEVMFIQKNRSRTTVTEPIGETLAELPFTGDQVVCLGHDAAGSASFVSPYGPRLRCAGSIRAYPTFLIARSMRSCALEQQSTMPRDPG
jgi:hypothetical protein